MISMFQCDDEAGCEKPRHRTSSLSSPSPERAVLDSFWRFYYCVYVRESTMNDFPSPRGRPRQKNPREQRNDRPRHSLNTESGFSPRRFCLRRVELVASWHPQVAVSLRWRASEHFVAEVSFIFRCFFFHHRKCGEHFICSTRILNY